MVRSVSSGEAHWLLSDCWLCSWKIYFESAQWSWEVMRAHEKTTLNLYYRSGFGVAQSSALRIVAGNQSCGLSFIVRRSIWLLADFVYHSAHSMSSCQEWAPFSENYFGIELNWYSDERDYVLENSKQFWTLSRTFISLHDEVYVCSIWWFIRGKLRCLVSMMIRVE